MINYLVIYLIRENWIAKVLWTQTRPGSAITLFLCNFFYGNDEIKLKTIMISWSVSHARTPCRKAMTCNYCSIWINIPGLGSVSAVGSYLSNWIVLYFSFRVLLPFSREVHGTTFRPRFHGSRSLMLSIWCSLYVYTWIESWKNPLQLPSRMYRGFPQ